MGFKVFWFLYTQRTTLDGFFFPPGQFHLSAVLLPEKVCGKKRKETVFCDSHKKMRWLVKLVKQIKYLGNFCSLSPFFNYMLATD